MKITSPLNNSLVGAVTTTRSGSNASPASLSTGGKSAVAVSSTARHLSNLQNSDNDIDVERVQAIRDAIAAGQLKVDPSRIADSLIASVRDLLK
ncbi:MAG TPA: flagellar biosynthesis anti-sigma factor FlgM [Eoetvoesiella sp.]